MKVFVDFDRTLFDCDFFLSDFYKIISKYNISRDLFNECQNQCDENGFSLYLILNEVEKRMSVSQDIYKDVDGLLEDTSKYLYKDSIMFLKWLRENDYNVIILSKGNMEYQSKKIINSGILDYCDDVIITMRHKGDLKLDYKNSIFIDDNPKEIESIMKSSPKMVIRIKRNNSRYNDVLLKNILEVSNFNEIIKAISK